VHSDCTYLLPPSTVRTEIEENKYEEDAACGNAVHLGGLHVEIKCEWTEEYGWIKTIEKKRDPKGWEK
jgi:hypothetical protein